jgi:glycine cleavage system T protein (aminomethyltransferase)
MIRTTPFHERTNALNETGLWEHWSNHLVAVRYQMSEKFEYFAIRNAAGIFDTSPLYKYRFTGPDAERYLRGVLARDPAKCAVGKAQYTLWCDDRGFVIEDGVLLHLAEQDYLLTAAEPNLAYFESLVDGLDVSIQDVSNDWGILSIQGPRARDILKVWDAVWEASRGQGVIPFGMTALYMARIEAGLVLLDVDFHSSRFAWTDADRSTPIELGLGWMFRDLAPSANGPSPKANGANGHDRSFIGRDAIRRELRDKTSRWQLSGLVVDWQDYDRIYDRAGLIPPKDHTPVQDEYYVYDDELNQLGYATSQMYSPMLQRHIALARVPLDRATPGSRVKLELAVSHRYEYFDAHVARLPLFNPQRRTA